MGEDALVLRLFLTAGLSAAVLGGALAVGLYALAGRGPLFPPVGPVRPARDGATVVVAFFGLIAAQVIGQTLFPPLWGPVVVYPVLVAAILVLVQTQGGPNPFGLRRAGTDVVAGYLTWLLVTPAVFAVFVLAIKGNQWLIDRPPDKHPLTQGIDEAGPWGWPLFFLQTVLLAPVVEELAFRGMLLPWLAQKRPAAPVTALTIPPVHRPFMILALAVGIAVLLHSNEIQKARTAGDRHELVAHLVPAAFFLALVPFDLVLPRLLWLRRHLRIRSAQHVRAVWASSALFAAVHSQVWPSPVPLFVLAIGLGYLYLRTRTLVGPVVVHGLFNAVSAVYLLLGGPA